MDRAIMQRMSENCQSCHAGTVSCGRRVQYRWRRTPPLTVSNAWQSHLLPANLQRERPTVGRHSMNTLAFLAGEQGIIVVIAILLMVGGKKLPELARGLGQSIREFNKAKNEGPEIAEVSRNNQLPPA